MRNRYYKIDKSPTLKGGPLVPLNFESMKSMDINTPHNAITRQIVIIFATMFLLVHPGYSTELSLFNFTYSDGDKPWLTHIPSKTNTTYEAALDEYQCIACMGNSIDFKKTPNMRVNYICLEGRGAKMVVPLGHPNWDHLVFNSPKEGGLSEQKHMIKGHPNHYYDKSKYSTKYFLIPFDDYEIPTFYPVESKIYLPVWRNVFQSINNMSDEFFTTHVRVMSTSVKQVEFEGKLEKHFIVIYYYHVDWARIKLYNGFVFGKGEIGLNEKTDSDALTDSLTVLEERLKKGKRSRSRYIEKIELTTSIASKEEIILAAGSASPLLGSDVNSHFRLNFRGQLVLRLVGTIDKSANKCLEATIMLKDASVSGLREIPCWIH